MILAIVLVGLLSPHSVRAEPVEAVSFFATLRKKDRPSTGSGRTEAGTALDAERAFAADARTLGQWTAFRKWAAPDATMFVPQPIDAQSWLKARKDPPKAVEWWPTASYVSCDGKTAVNTGGWKRPDGSVGYFSTVWQRQKDGGWKWIVDDGDGLKAARPKTVVPAVFRASCKTAKPEPQTAGNERHQEGISHDGSLIWGWALNATGHTRVFDVGMWDGERYSDGFEDLIDVL